MTNPAPHGQVPEALRLADWLDGCVGLTSKSAAAELRRLHAYCQELESQVIRDCMTHVQNPAENEHVAGDVLKNGAEVNMNVYAELPQSVGDHKYGGGLYTDAQMLAFADATHALRASHGQAPAQADDFGSAEHWKEKAQYWAGVAHRLRGEALRGEPVDGIIQPVTTAQAAQQAPAGATSPWSRALEIRIAQGWMLKGDRLPVLYTDTINGDGVGRDDLWLCTTSALAAPAAPSTPASGGWISVDERLPPSARPVLACNPCGFIGRAEFSSGRWNHIGKPSHWMPLPPLPASPTIERESK